MSNNCIFCKIINREIQSVIVFENDDILAFKDINPQAPIHILIVPKKHIPTINDVNEEDSKLIAAIFYAAKDIAKKFNISDSGYRCVFNCNKDAGQEVFHIHLHLLGGRIMKWPPG
ncbi:MAG TPA: histidine triad nucleotide-binding protein [bacterium]|nr:histidine triad nucleotide-binding protein [bacterium]HPP87927.1 histidine triad nucleotide-binding protein [bacterium]